MIKLGITLEFIILYDFFLLDHDVSFQYIDVRPLLYLKFLIIFLIFCLFFRNVNYVYIGFSSFCIYVSSHLCIFVIFYFVLCVFLKSLFHHFYTILSCIDSAWVNSNIPLTSLMFLFYFHFYFLSSSPAFFEQFYLFFFLISSLISSILFFQFLYQRKYVFYNFFETVRITYLNFYSFLG